LSNHPMAARKIAGVGVSRKETQLSPRQTALRYFAEGKDLVFYPQRQRNPGKYRDFPIHKGNKILYEQNVIVFYPEDARIEVSDITLSEGARQAQQDTHITALHLSDLNVQIPDFALEPEGLWSRVSELVAGKDIDFAEYPLFSSRYYLRGNDETATRVFFTEKLIRFFEDNQQMHVECHRNKLLIYKKRELMEISEIENAERFAEELLKVIHEGQKTAQAVFGG